MFELPAPVFEFVQSLDDWYILGDQELEAGLGPLLDDLNERGIVESNG